MHIVSLHLRNFRNWRNATVRFSKGANCILGRNGQGKTNLLEAIHLLSTGRSFRTKALADLIRHGADFFYLEASFVKDGISQSLSITYGPSQKRIKYNQTEYQNFSQLLGILPSVLFAPSDINIINGAPLERRRFFNMHIAQADPLYVYHLARYHRALKQRNELLKRRQRKWLSIWEHALSSSALYLMQARSALLDGLLERVPEFLHKISGSEENFALEYLPSLPCQDLEQMKKAFDKGREKDLQCKTTLCGPHRDDFSMTIDSHLAKGFSSEGQKRSILAAMRCAEWQQLEQRCSAAPLLSIDDFGTHLDEKRIKLFQKVIENEGQIFLTMPLDISQMPFSSSERTIHIEKGNVSG